MIKHYLTVAFRNMWKYKNQTLVSVTGLAVGFVCFAMATLWIRYEMTYDSFHKNADRIYCVNISDAFSPTGIARDKIPSPLAGYLRSTFPEITNAIVIIPLDFDFEYEGVNHKNVNKLRIDSSFLSMFNVKIVEGSMDFLIPKGRKVAITREKALQLFGNESPVGKKINLDSYYYEFADYEICAVVTGFSGQSNYPFGFLRGIATGMRGDNYYVGNMLIEVVPGIGMEAFEKKLNEHNFQQKEFASVKNITLTPLTAVHYKDQNIEREVKFQHIIIFAVAGSLLILCTLFNYLTLFVSRFRIRRRELALRTVYGASGRSLFAMLSVEFIMSLIVSLILGLISINILSSYFLTVSGTQLELPAIYLESVIYIAGIIVAALTAFFLTLVFFRRRTLNTGIRGNKKMLRKISIVAQLIISIVFAFCTLIILKQMYYLHNSVDLGFSLKNRASISIGIASEEIAILNDKMKQIPEIKETLTGHYPLLPVFSKSFVRISNWDGKQEDAEITVECATISEQYAKFYEFKLIEGEFFKDDDNIAECVMITESAAKSFGWNKAAGKSFNNSLVVKGVIKDVYSFSPTIAAKPCYYHRQDSDLRQQISCILFKYDEGSWKICVEKIKEIIEKEFPNRDYMFSNMEEEYNKYLKSENALLAILTAVSLVCLIVCVFGFVSMVSLTCEERRKEIAIRKINGATIKDILDIFFKEHLTLLITGALIAFPVGYVIMKRWLEQYVIQTEMSAWIYLSILLALFMVIVMCVGGRVYKTSRENPVNALNK
jgi:ABC-type antimicrobial peptide transport system permease subunit